LTGPFHYRLECLIFLYMPEEVKRQAEFSATDKESVTESYTTSNQ